MELQGDVLFEFDPFKRLVLQREKFLVAACVWGLSRVLSETTIHLNFIQKTILQSFIYFVLNTAYCN